MRPARSRMLAVAASLAAAAAATLALPSPGYAAGGPYRAIPVDITAPASGPNTTLIAGAYIVTMKTGANPQSPIRALGAKDAVVYDSALNGFATRLSTKQLNELRHNADVVAIEQDAWHTDVVDTTQNNPPSWGIDRIDQVNLPLSKTYSYTADGTGVSAYIIDSGIDINHPDFGGRAVWGTNTIDTNNTDCLNHGTHVAGTVGSNTYGVAKGVRLVAVKWLNCSGSGTTSGAINAVNWVKNNAAKPAVANASWNITYSSTLATALTNMMNSGVFLAASAGNTGGNSCDRLPRNLTAVLVVAASTSADKRASYSSTGSCVDVYGPGSAIISTIPGNSTASFNGTSMATPHATGIAALYKDANGDAGQSTVHTWIVNNSSSNVLTGSLLGTPNRLLNKRSL